MSDYTYSTGGVKIHLLLKKDNLHTVVNQDNAYPTFTMDPETGDPTSVILLSYTSGRVLFHLEIDEAEDEDTRESYRETIEDLYEAYTTPR